jgi:hypothetical protein
MQLIHSGSEMRLKMKRNALVIILSGLLIPVGILLAGNASSTGIFWCGAAMALIGLVGSITAIYQRHVDLKSRQYGRDSSNPGER